MSSKRDLDDARRALGRGRSTGSARPIRPSDVLERYGKKRPDTVGVREGSTRGTNGHASQLPHLSKERGNTRGKTGARPGRPLAPVAGDKTESVPPSVGRPSKGRPVAGDKPTAGRPTLGRPGSLDGKSSGKRPVAGRPGKGSVDSKRPVAGRPRKDTVAGRPGKDTVAGRPGKGKGGPTISKPGTGRPGTKNGSGSGGPGGRPIAIGGGGARDPLGAGRGQAGKRYDQRLRTARPVGGVTGGPLQVAGGRPDRPRGGTTHVGGVWTNGGWSGQGSYFGNCYWNTWGGCYGNTWGSWFCSPLYLSGFWWDCYWRRGGSWGFGFNGWNRGLWSPWRNCYWYGPSLPAAVSVVVYDDPDPEPEVIYIEASEPEVIYVDGVAPSEDVSVVGGTGAVPAPAVPFDGPAADAAEGDGIDRELSRAAAYYLSQGDRAFRETRYGDAVHAYAKAVEFAPESGVLYLVLSDALFATGDYRYAAFALRQAAEREPALFENVVDKRDFYAEPGEFETQLAVLERYVRDHVLDVDARLVLSANYLFGGRPGFALEVLENPFSEELRGTELGDLMLRVAQGEVEGDR
ncbi:MAG: hypothetical protein AAFU73_07230 [Planctomycetota bacterium]